MTGKFSGTCGEYLRHKITELTGSPEILSRTPVSGGDINRAEVLELKGGRRIFIKRNSARLQGLFAEEADGLASLGAAGGLRVPEVLGLHRDSSEQILVLEYIPTGIKGEFFWDDFARGLTAIHRTSHEKGFGFNGDNHIGATEQLNDWTGNWLGFFAEKRIGFQLDLARKTGRADAPLLKAGEQFLRRLDTILPEPDTSSLLHGDLWGGNYMVDSAGAPVLIDPAVYYGHREADIAMTELFGGFNPRLFSIYNEIWPLEPGFPERRDAYNLYHLLNHLNMFGGSYYSSVLSILRHYA